MIIDDHTYDLIVIGSGAAGGTLAAELAGAGRSVLLLERGGLLPLEDQNVVGVDLFRNDRYHSGTRWFGPDGDPFSPQTVYAVGGNTKIWGGVLERMREEEFAPLQQIDGTSPGWDDLDYATFEPFYQRAEHLYRVHGCAGVDPAEPQRHGDYALPPRPVEPLLVELRAALQRQDLHPYDLPISWSESKEDPSGDAERFAVEPAVASGRLQLRTGARVRRLHVNPSGTEIRGVQVEIDGQNWLFSSHVVVLAAGAVNTAQLLLRSAIDSHPTGLANGSDQVGRNLMRTQLTSILQRSRQPHSGRFAQGLGINDYYWGDRNVSRPLGQIQGGGGVLQDPLFAESPPLLSLITKVVPNFVLERLATRTISWWALSSVRPDPDNRVSLRGKQLNINYVPNNIEAHDRLVYRWLNTLRKLEADPLNTVAQPFPIHPRGQAPLTVMGYVSGTARLGSNPATSVVNLDGRSHQIGNLYIADASVFPSCPSVGPGLTVIAFALRQAEHLQTVL